MELQKNTAYRNKLKRLGRQLALSENLLQTHPLVKDKLTVLPTILHYFNLQMEWTLAGPSARLLMTFRSALQAQEMGKSQTGFIGPALHRMQQAVAHLMSLSLNPSEKELTSLLLTFTQVIALGTLYVDTQLLENGKRLFPETDLAANQKASFLLRELGLTFVLGSRTIESAFRAVSQGLSLKESSQKRVIDIGMFFLLSLLILVNEQDSSQDEEFIETIKRFLKPTLDSVELALQQAQSEGYYEDELALLAFGQLQLIRSALDTSEGESLKQVLANNLDSLGLPYHEVKQDLNRLIAFCSQLNESFRNIFYQAGMTATTIIQAA